MHMLTIAHLSTGRNCKVNQDVLGWTEAGPAWPSLCHKTPVEMQELMLRAGLQQHGSAKHWPAQTVHYHCVRRSLHEALPVFSAAADDIVSDDTNHIKFPEF